MVETDTSQGGNGSGTGPGGVEPPRRGLWSALAALQLLALSFEPAIRLWDREFAHRPAIGGPLLVASCTLAAATIAVLVGTRIFRFSVPGTVSVVSVAVLGFFGWQAFGRLVRRPDRLPDPAGEEMFGYGVIAVLVALALILGRTRAFRIVLLATVLSSAGIPAASLVEKVVTASSPPAVGGPVLTPEASAERPDVVVVVLDAYGRQDTLRGLYGFDNADFLASLESLGFFVVREAVANYSMTYVSVPAMMSMRYPLDANTTIHSGTERVLYDAMRGDNATVRSLRGAGYEYIHFESGWGGTRCGPVVDRCIRAPFPDDDVWGILERTPLVAALRPRIGHAFTHSAMDRLRRLGDVLLEPHARPRLVFAHLMLPHPPLLLDAACRLRYRHELDARVVGATYNQTISALRRDAYAEQVRCVNARLLRIVETIPRGDIVLLTGDHGPDSQDQLSTPLAGWTQAAVEERMRVFSAYRLPRRCARDLYPSISPVNAFRIAIPCAVGARLPLLPDTHTLVRVPEEGRTDRSRPVSVR